VYTFVANFRAFLDAQNVAHTADLDAEYDVLFVNSWLVPYDDVRHAKETHPRMRVVHRVDGSSLDYGGYRDGDARQARVNLLADLTIFQSQYSKVSTTVKHRIVRQDGPVIFNPVDVALFAPDGPRFSTAPGRPTVACASWSTNPRKGAPDVNRLASAHADVDFVLCGRFEGIADRPNVIRLGHLSRGGMAHALRSCDALLNLSENDPAPNVVIEALASGLPVLYRDSGGVGELVGDCGIAVTPESFRPALEDARARRASLSRAARARAVEKFAPAVIFPQYLAAVADAARHPSPGAWATLKLAIAGYPVLPAPWRASHPHERPGTRPPGRKPTSRPYRIGWTTYDSFGRNKRELSELESFTRMRVGNLAQWLNDHCDHLANELYDPRRTYDVVVFHKVMDPRARRHVARLKNAGTAVVFDANVNYYEIWGDYRVPGTKPTAAQREHAIWMTEQADWVVADSNYIASVVRKFTDRVSTVPDNVNLDVYRGTKRHEPKDSLALIWSGVAKKADHLRLIAGMLPKLAHVTLTLVTDGEPDLAWLPPSVPRRVVPFSNETYAATLLESDVIVSPKDLANGYEMGHTEYKIALGMAVGLPAVASPQPSYVEAVSHLGGGFIAYTPYEWETALMRLAADHRLRADFGDKARRTVLERYSTPAVARLYLDVLDNLAGGRPGAGQLAAVV
jgi:glycosyltransferase involved in cell wall biosynthesis